jgi:GLPGLI family protein
MLPISVLAQIKYIASYEQKVAIDFSNIKVNSNFITVKYNNADSSKRLISDTAIKEIINNTLLEKILKEQLGNELTVYTNVRADAFSAELEYYSGNGASVNSKKKFENGSWYSLKKGDDHYVKDNQENKKLFNYTGQLKQILGYTCYEAKDIAANDTCVVWVCKALPATVSPGIKLDGIDGAIFEYNDGNKMHITIKSIQEVKNQ